MKKALITGASKRIGKAVAEFLAEKGWNILIHYNKSGNEATGLINRLKLKFPQQHFGIIQANLSHTNEVTELIPKAISEFGGIDLLVNNASVFNRGSVENTPVDLLDSQMNINLKAPFILIRDFARYCKKGNIINFVDTRITTNSPVFAAYSLSKKALWELTKMAALEFAPDIRVNAIAPGATLAPENKEKSYLVTRAKATPMKQPGGVIPVVKSVAFILENNHLTGQLLFADGGENLGIPPNFSESENFSITET